MGNLLGGFFKNISSMVNKEIKKTLYKNETFLNTRWSFIEKSIVRWSTYYKKYIFLTLVLAGLVTSNFIIWQPWVKPYVIQYAPNWRNILEWQSIFLGGQLTIIGVVYPLVVGLIGILFQNKSAKNIIFPLYQKYSGFMFAGLSGLMLSGFIVVGYLFRAIVSDYIYVAICITSSLWFSTNLLLTAWFFVKTFTMLNESSREEIILRFSIHEACELDIRQRMKKILLNNAIDCKKTSLHNKDIMDVSTFSNSSERNEKITKKVPRNSTLKDVRLWLLNSAIFIQIYILKFGKNKNGKLVIKPTFDNNPKNIINIATYSGFKLNPLVNLLIKKSFSFEKNIHENDVGLLSVLNAFIGPVDDAIRDGDTREFSKALEKLSLWHTNLAATLSFEDHNGNLDNWLTLSTGTFFGRSYLDELISEYYRIARVTVEKIPDNSCYYKDMLRFHRKIFSQRETLIRQEMKSLIQASYYMWYLLLEWNSYDVNHGDLRVAHRYEDILYDFVGAWESWPMYIEPRSKRTGDISHVFPAFIEHLEATASTAISALRFGNFEAAGWGIDMLNHWFEKLSTDNHWNAEFHWRTVLINIYLLPIETSSDIWQLILNNNAYNYNAAFDLSFKNAHLDLRVITACYILLKPGNEQSKLLVKYVRALLSGERIHPSGLARQCRNKISNAGDVLGVYIRHRDYRQNDNNSYGNWLSSILESFGRIYEEKRVSGRMYSGWSANDPQSMNRAYVEIAISMSSTLWKLSRNWEEAIFSGFFGHMEQKRIISDLNDWINIANTEHNYILVNPDVLDVHKTNFIKSIEDIINSINKAQIKVIIDAEIDQDQLVRLGGEISKNLDNHYLNKFPLVFFENFERRTELSEDSSYKVNVPNVSKAWVASGINANLELHEDSWMVDFISENIKERVFIPLQTYPKSASHKYTDMDSFLSAIRKNAESMACPVMFVGDEIFGEKLRQLSYEPNVIDRDGIIHQDGFDTQYICHVGNCEVYSINSNYFDYCLLTSKELFDTISMREIADDRYVDVNFKLNDDSETTGILEFKYYMKIKLSHETPCIKFLLEIADDNSA